MIKRNISRSLSSAACSLLGLSTSISPASAEPWDVDLGVMNYIEQDRNTGLEFLLNAEREFADGDQLRLGVEIDTLTGATPNGATATNQIQTFTQSSGDGSYRVAADELPADDTHMDTRLSVDAGYSNQYRDDASVSYDGHISMEFDYLSFGAGHGYQWDLNQRNTTVDLGFYAEYNRVHPVGNIPLPLTTMNPAGSLQNRRGSSDTRKAAEVGIGITQIIGRKSLVQLRFTQSHFSGYLNDPYKLLSIVDDQNAGNLGATLEYRFENRPDRRDMSTLYIGYKLGLDDDVLDLAFRVSDDNWGITGTAVEMRYRFALEGQSYIQPQIRLYHQNEADFFRHSLTSSESLPGFASADTRLAEFDAMTLGVKYGFHLNAESRHSIVAVYYTQQGDSSPGDAVGLQRQQDLFPTLKTLVVKYLFSTRW